MYLGDLKKGNNWLILVILPIILLCACEQNINGPLSDNDITAPAAVNDLTVVDSSPTTVTLIWTAPGDDGSIGTASSYDIRYSKEYLDNTNWNTAAQADAPQPKPAETQQSIVIMGLEENQEYYFAIKAGDEAGNSSGLSNVSSGKTTASECITWEKVFGGNNTDEPSMVIKTDRGYLIGGRTSSYGRGYGDFWLIQISQKGDKIWEQTYGTGKNEELRSLCSTADGGYILAGETGWVQSPEVYLVKTDQSGNEEWTVKWDGLGDARAQSIISTASGGYIVTGTTNTGMSEYPQRSGSFIISLNRNGEIVDSLLLDDALSSGLSGFVCRSIIQVADGYILAGNRQSQPCFAKVSADFKSINVELVGLDGYVWSMAACPRGGGIAVGWTPADSDNSDLMLIKISESGEQEWAGHYHYGDVDVRDRGYAVKPNPEGGYIATGTTKNGDWADIFMVGVDGSGSEKWQKRYGQVSSADLGLSITVADDGGYLVAGSTWPNGWDPADVLLLKTNSRGDL